MTARLRRIVGTVLLVLAGILVPISVVSTWTARTVTDTDAFVARVAPVAGDPAVQTYVAGQIADQVNGAVIQGVVGPKVNDAIDGLQAPDLVKALLHSVAANAGGWVEARVDKVATKVVQAPAFQTAFTDSLTIAHGELVKTLEGDASGVVVGSDNTVSIKIATLTNAIKSELTSAGFSLAERIPTVEATIPIANVSRLEQFRGYYRMLRVLVWLGPVLVLLLAVGGYLLRRDPVRSTLWFGWSGLLATAVVMLVAKWGVASASDGILDPQAHAAARATVDTVTSSLETNGWIVVVILVLVVLGAHLWPRREKITARLAGPKPEEPLSAPATP